jgi:hypothetical protein
MSCRKGVYSGCMLVPKFWSSTMLACPTVWSPVELLGCRKVSLQRDDLSGGHKAMFMTQAAL